MKHFPGVWPIMFLVLFVAFSAPAGEDSAVGAILEVPDLFVPGSGRPPKAGEWLEYRISFLVDPLENNLSREPLQPISPNLAESSAPPEGGTADQWISAFEPLPVWQILPLRLEILSVDEEVCQARLAFAGTVAESSMPLKPEPTAPFHYPS
ncbi:MAG: hypothetical protein LBE84_08340, partial [Planctomycetota bacterium]|nr:hypothetical protein [Planctomycetota bacterium]